MQTDKALPVAAATVVAVVFGFSFIFTKGALAYLAPFQLLVLRFALAAFFLTLLAACRIIKLNLRTEKLPALLKIALWQPVLYFLFETYGIKLTSASESGVVIALVPLAITLLSVIMLGERITAAQGACAGAAVAGVIVMALAGPAADGNDPGGHLLGILMLFGAVVAGGLYNIFSRRAAANFTPMEITFIMMWLGALVFNAIGLAQGLAAGDFSGYTAHLGQLPVAFGLLYLGLLSSVGAFFLLNYALSRMPASRTAVFLNLIPLVSLLAGVVFYRERLGPWQLAGCTLILLGVWGVNYFAGRTLRIGEAGQVSP